MMTIGYFKGYVYKHGTTTPLLGATVTASIGTTIYATYTTGSDGAYLLPVPGGTYTVTAAATGYPTRTATLTVAGGGTTNYNFQ